MKYGKIIATIPSSVWVTPQVFRYVEPGVKDAENTDVGGFPELTRKTGMVSLLP